MKAIIAACILLLSPASFAGSYYLCTDGSGKKSYQDKPCPEAATQESRVVKVEQTKDSSIRQWKIQAKTDEMTGEKSCLIYSDYFAVSGGGKLEWVGLFVRKLGPEAYSAGVHQLDKTPIFHSDLSGLGITIGENEFIQLTKKYGQGFISFSLSDTQRVIDQLKQSTSFRVRVRYWPYDQSYTSDEERYTGFAKALEQLQACSVG